MQKNRVKEIGKKNIAMKYKREQKYGWLMFEKREQIRPIKTNISCNVIKNAELNKYLIHSEKVPQILERLI